MIFKNVHTYRVICLFVFSIVSCSAFGFDLYGHRGARGLAPENTLPAYEAALKSGVNYVDMDVMMTKDHVVVVQHDLTLNPNITRDEKKCWIKNNNIIVKNLSLHQLQQYDVGRIKPGAHYAKLFSHQRSVDNTPIPTLQQVIEYVKKTSGNKVGFQIEIKTDPTYPEQSGSPEELAKAVADVVAKEHVEDRTQVQAFDWRCLLALQKINPKIATAYLTEEDFEVPMQNTNPKIAGLWTAGQLLKNYHNSIPTMIKKMGGKYWDPQDTEVTSERLREAHQLGLKVIVWFSVEQSGKEYDPAVIKKLVDMGVDGIITDRPDKVKQS